MENNMLEGVEKDRIERAWKRGKRTSALDVPVERGKGRLT